MRRAVLLSVLALSTGCAGHVDLDFVPDPPAPLQSNDPSLAVATLTESLPVRFQRVDSIVFSFRGRPLSAIGYSEVDEGAGRFTVVALNHVGMKLFEIAGVGEKVERRFVMPELSRRGDPAGAIAADIRRIYFHRVPSAAALVSVGRDSIRFCEETAEGTLCHVLGGPDGVLSEKSLTAKGRLLWRIRYARYQGEKGRLQPGEVLLEDLRYHYELLIRLREVRG